MVVRDIRSDVDLTLRRKSIVRNIDLAFATRNLFDADIREPASSSLAEDYPMEGRSAWAELRVNY